MDPRTALKIVDRLQELERGDVTVRLGVITDTSPLSVALGGSDVPYTNVKALGGQALTVDDVVVVLTWGRDLLILGFLGTGTGEVTHLSYAGLHETVDPVGVANQAIVFARDNGSGKTQFCVRYGSGAVKVIDTEL